MAWRVAEALETLRKQLNEAFPKRSKASDGGIGDAKHASRSSDHNPYLVNKGVGVVSARDFTHDPKTGIDCQWLADTLVKNKDPRIKYIIWNKQICSSQTSPWKWRPYKGVNGHTKHLHLSVIGEPKLYDSTKPWKLDFPKNGKSDVAKISGEDNNTQTATSSTPADGQNLPISTDDPTASSPETIVQNAEQIINTGDASNIPPPENKELTAPTKDGATSTATKMTIGGIVVPGFVVATIETVRQWIAEGYISAAEVGSTVLGFIKENQKYVFLLIGLLIVLLIVKKIVKQVTFWLELISKAVPQFNNITVVPTETEPPSKWWQIWK